MKKFVGTILFDKKIDFTLEKFKIVEILKNNNEFLYYFFGSLDVNSGEELFEFFSKKANILDMDISFETEEDFVILNDKILNGKNKYELVSFEGELVNFKEIISRFEENFEVFCVREAEFSEKFGNKIIKVDFFY